uniref:hypothetical protein n=1 Tax=Ruegeria sp. HKCCA4707 TaxID=2682984 RepID=UPI001487B59D|nr:hypothetical protein [Ruegeria sp. HKCCA4707]
MEKTTHNPVAVSFRDLTVDPARYYFAIGPDREFFACITAALPAGVYYRFHDVDPYSVRGNALNVEKGLGDRHADYIAERVTDTPWFLYGYNGIVCAHRNSWGSGPAMCGFSATTSAWLPVIGRTARGHATRNGDIPCAVCGANIPADAPARFTTLPKTHPEFDADAFERSAPYGTADYYARFNKLATCSTSCNDKARHRAKTRVPIANPVSTCACCGETFTPKRATAKYCSTACRNRANYLASTAKAAE